MAFSTILRISASSLAPVASRLARINRCYHSTIFTASNHFNQKSILSSFVPDFHFSTFADAGDKTEKLISADKTVIDVIDMEIWSALESNKDHDRVEETLSEFPFKIEDNPGRVTTLLTGGYRNELITIEARMFDDKMLYSHSSTQKIKLLITFSKNDGLSLQFTCLGTLEEISINNLKVYSQNSSEDEILLEGPHFSELDENLKIAFYRYLEVRGINLSTMRFLFEYKRHKGAREHLNWLKKMKNFIEA